MSTKRKIQYLSQRLWDFIEHPNCYVYTTHWTTNTWYPKCLTKESGTTTAFVQMRYIAMQGTCLWHLVIFSNLSRIVQKSLSSCEQILKVPNPLQKADWSAALVCCCRSWYLRRMPYGRNLKLKAGNSEKTSFESLQRASIRASTTLNVVCTCSATCE